MSDVLSRATRRKEVNHPMAVCRQPFGNVLAVAVIGIAFGAHDANLPGSAGERRSGLAEG
jgi:hypothetical protein